MSDIEEKIDYKKELIEAYEELLSTYTDSPYTRMMNGDIDNIKSIIKRLLKLDPKNECAQQLCEDEDYSECCRDQ